MRIDIYAENARLMRALREVQPTLKKPWQQMVRAGARLALAKAIEMTPPGESGMQGMEAKKRGENAIRQDALGGKRGPTQQTKRGGIFFVADEGLLRKWQRKEPDGKTRLFVRKDGSVWGTETQFYKPNASLSDMDAHHARYWKNGKMSSGGARTRDIGRWVFIDRMVVGKGAMNRWLKHRYKRVGWLAAGWMTAANELKVGKIPAWIKRHPGSGKISFKESGGSFSVFMVNATKYGRAAQLERIVPYALAAASAGMKAQAKHVALKALKKAGLTVTSALSLAT